MPVFDLYSKRQKRERGEFPEIFIYDKLPLTLRIQIIHIIEEAIGATKSTAVNRPRDAYRFIHKVLCKEYGTFSVGKYGESDHSSIRNFIYEKADIELVIDVVELCFDYISRVIGKNLSEYTKYTKVHLSPEEAIGELNIRFREHGIGYQFESNQIIRIDSTFVHSEITIPTLTLLRGIKFSGANEEYLKAHEHYRHGNNKECLNECLKAFESTLKIICSEKGWSFNPSDTSKRLIQICFQNGLVPSFTQNQFTSIQNLLESGISTIRNKLGGHGQGQIPQKVDDDITRYSLNLTGSNIIFSD